MFQLKRQSGASLIEVLVAIFIFSVGMLGIAALTTTAMRYQSGNIARSNLSASIADLSDRLRGNVMSANGFITRTAGTTTSVVSTSYNYTATYSSQLSSTITFPTTPNCASTTCTGSQLATYDLAAWRKNLRENLPGGAGYITGNVKDGFDVTVMWFDKDFVRGDDASFTDSPEAARTCDSADAVGSAATRYCCPAAVSAPAGVRCYSVKVFP